MSPLTAVVTSRYPNYQNQLRLSSNPCQQATIYDGKVTVQPVQGRQTTYAAGTTRKYTAGEEGHIAKQCTKPKRKRDETWFNDKVLLVQAQASGQALSEEEIAFLADPGLPDIQNSQTVMTHNAAYQAVIWMPKTLIVMNSIQPKLLSWPISQGMAQMHLLRYKEEVKDLKEKQNVEKQFSPGSNESFAETLITTTNEVPSRKPIVLDSDSPKPVVKLVYSRKPRKNKNTEPVRKTKASQSSSGIGFGCTTAHDRRPLSSSPISSVNSLGYSQIGNDHVAKIMGFELFRLGSYYFKGLLR
ncbi:hypothetical protein Tco_0079777 [Tanacetum coccineum]